MISVYSYGKVDSKINVSREEKRDPIDVHNNIITFMKLYELFFRIRIEKVCICIVFHIKFKFFFSGTVVLKVPLLVKLQ